jgi:hypothetical protein
MVAVPPLEAVLVMVTVPVSAPAVVGSNCRSSVAVWPAVRVTGAASPDIEKPVPLIAAALIVTEPVPLDVSFTVCVAGVFRSTLPKATLADPSVNPAVPVVPVVPVDAAFNCRGKVSELPLFEAVNIAVCVEMTAETVAVNLALDAPAATASEAGTLTALLLLARLTVIALPVAAVSVTVQASPPAPVIVALLHVSELKGCELRTPRCCPSIRPGAQHRIVTIPAIRQCFDAPESRLCPDRASNCEGWLHSNASSAATARPKEGGMSLKSIRWHLVTPGHTPAVSARGTPAARSLPAKRKGSS